MPRGIYKHKDRHNWNEQDDKFLIQNQTLTARQIATYLGRSKGSIDKRRIKLGLSIIDQYKWSNDEDEWLKSNHRQYTTKQISIILHKTEGAIKQRLSKLRLVKEQLSFSDEDFLNAVANSRSHRAAAQKLGYVIKSGSNIHKGRYGECLHRLNPDISHFISKRIKFTDEQFLEAVRTSRSQNEVASKLGYKSSMRDETTVYKFFERLKPDISHFNLNSRSGLKLSNPYERYYEIYKREALKRNLTFTISLERFIELVESKCVYCGSSGDTITNYKNKNKKSCGIDRIVNGNGYEDDNCVACCRTCNFMKRDIEQSTFVSQAIKIADYQRSLQSADTTQEKHPD